MPAAHARFPRIAWLFSFAIPLVLLVLMCVAMPDDAVGVIQSPPPPGPTEPAPEDEAEGEESEEECVEEDGEEGEWEGEEGEEECEEGGAETSSLPPHECILRTALARVFTYTAQDRTQLVIRYTSRSPADVAVDYRLKGTKGGLLLGQAKQRFAKKGLFRLNENLSPMEMAKVRAASAFTVQMRIPGAPHNCNQYYSRHLTIRRAVGSQVVWLQSDSIFGT